MTRSEHVKWCKERSLKEYTYYEGLGDRTKGIREAVNSMVSDLIKHPETADMMLAAHILGMTVKTENDMIQFIDGFK